MSTATVWPLLTPLPASRRKRPGLLYAVMAGHTAPVRGAIELSDRLLSWGRDGTVRFWSVEGAPIGEALSAHDGGVAGATVLSNGCILTGGNEGAILWNADGE